MKVLRNKTVHNSYRYGIFVKHVQFLLQHTKTEDCYIKTLTHWDYVQSDMMNNMVEYVLQGKPKYPKKTCTSTTLSTKNITWHGIEPGTSLLESGDQPAELRDGPYGRVLTPAR